MIPGSASGSARTLGGVCGGNRLLAGLAYRKGERRSHLLAAGQSPMLSRTFDTYSVYRLLDKRDTLDVTRNVLPLSNASVLWKARHERAASVLHLIAQVADDYALHYCGRLLALLLLARLRVLLSLTLYTVSNGLNFLFHQLIFKIFLKLRQAGSGRRARRWVLRCSSPPSGSLKPWWFR